MSIANRHFEARSNHCSPASSVISRRYTDPRLFFTLPALPPHPPPPTPAIADACIARSRVFSLNQRDDHRRSPTLSFTFDSSDHPEKIFNERVAREERRETSIGERRLFALAFRDSSLPRNDEIIASDEIVAAISILEYILESRDSNVKP